MVNLVDGLNQLITESQAYLDQFTSDEPINMEIKLTDTMETATLVIHQEISLNNDVSPDLRLLMTHETFTNIMSGDADFGAMIGRSKMSDKRPIDFEFIVQSKASQIMSAVYPLMTAFFTPGSIKVKNLNKSMAGDAHGAHPIPLVYWNGLRSAWYLIEKGEILNEAGEKDPYPQTFLIINGTGVAYIGENSLDIQSGQAIYIPTNVEHKIEAYEDIELLWLAWKTPLI